MDHLTKLIAHLAWADDRVLAALRATAPDPSCLEVFAHVLAAEHVARPAARARHRATPCGRRSRWRVRRSRAGEPARAHRHVAALGPADPPRGVTYKNSAGQEFTSSVEDILLHVCLHGSYHRGQIAWALRRGGGVPMPTDYIAMTRGAPAATRDAGRRS
jgi:uncharacterized damage-inducible protein DinB